MVTVHELAAILGVSPSTVYLLARDERKYHQVYRPDTPLYTSLGPGEQLADPTIPLLIVEGETKALAGVQAGC